MTEVEDPKVHSDAIIAIERLLQVIENSEGKYSHYTTQWHIPVLLYIAGTISRLRDEIKSATEDLIGAKTSIVSVSSGCELFLRFITLTSLEQTVSH